MTQALLARVSKHCSSLGRLCVENGLHPAWVGYRWLRHETVPEQVARRRGDPRIRYEVVHPAAIARNPLPCNVTARECLPAERGWWGYSFQDVPERPSGETFLATLPDCLVCWYRDPAQGHDFYPAIVADDGRALNLREIRFRPLHARTLRQAPPPARIDRATWIAERVYHNHSHWLTAHLPKLLLLREHGRLGDVLLPPERSAAIDDSLRLAGFDPASFRTFDPRRPLKVGELTVIGTDRFRPELLRLVPQAVGDVKKTPSRRIFISRGKAARRQLVNEDDLWPLLSAAGFERVFMEDLSFPEQVALMQDTAVLLAPHGAGLTNMLFCPPGAHVVELADLSFPNPNFYAVAAAMRHRYWVLPAQPLGDRHPLEKDLRADISAVESLLPRLSGR